MIRRTRPWRSSKAPAIGLTTIPGAMLAKATRPASWGELYRCRAKRITTMLTMEWAILAICMASRTRPSEGTASRARYEDLGAVSMVTTQSVPHVRRARRKRSIAWRSGGAAPERIDHHRRARALRDGFVGPAPKIRRGRLPERNVHFGVAARCGRVEGGNYLFHVSAQGRPLLVSENDKSDFSARQVLLVPDVFVGRQQKVKARGLSDRYQFAV